MKIKEVKNIEIEFTSPIKSTDAIENNELATLGQVKSIPPKLDPIQLVYNDNKLKVVINGVESNEVEIDCCSSPINFDVTADWSLAKNASNVSTPVTDANSFKAYLESGKGQNQYGNTFTDVVVTNFSLIDGRLKAFVTTSNSSNLALGYLKVTDVQIIELNVLKLQLTNNDISIFSPLSLPSNMTEISLNLQGGGIPNQQLKKILLNGPLPLSLTRFEADNNELNEVDFSTSLFTNCMMISLTSNSLTTASYAAMEPWANNLVALPQNALTVRLNDNTNSASGTNLKAILNSKGIFVST